ncbi:hypothetical protein HYALB_00007724 [Hymenoscyphus albidus]|uniref:Uncharacterized protein n=1 Tax=Hymenoscyphus albidus TaxID=595503 RepID=A0A9N9LCP4_9HELO|nr:hypothetical protein HYALB_00007724 [Hymenoscyphus albidus]
MSSIPFFCTANIPLELIKEFVVESQRPENTRNNWSLIRDPPQDEFDEETLGPLDHFDSGFLSFTIDDLKFYLKNLPEEHQETIAVSTFVVLDERTIRDKTVSIHHWTRETPDDVDESIDFDDWPVIESWKEWRVPFSSAALVASRLENDVYDRIKNEGGFSGKSDEHVDAEGVLRLPSLKMKDFEFLDDEGWPLGDD